ncbi:hypothetical protein DM01DRAFT_1334051 [Hesseltinella vesiculosa]|uniref:C2H2-type domain-containing protein n=1 Tax=Hesseltinella vesiculosa TaxID=101127 RepID=A0A1X2GMS6_9FUNG|nr:hypothetical protein DM01DRAFT_1334051 [Hesseltinella vesiculosa]
MGRLARKRNHNNKREIYRKSRTRNYRRDLDQIHDDVKPENAAKLNAQDIDTDLPGMAQHYCVECARYFINQEAMDVHTKGKLHKRRIKQLKEEPYTQAEADAAAGISKADNGKPGGRALVGMDVEMTE